MEYIGSCCSTQSPRHQSHPRPVVRGILGLLARDVGRGCPCHGPTPLICWLMLTDWTGPCSEHVQAALYLIYVFRPVQISMAPHGTSHHHSAYLCGSILGCAPMIGFEAGGLIKRLILHTCLFGTYQHHAVLPVIHLSLMCYAGATRVLRGC